MASDHIRASDRDRDAVVTTLRDAFAEGRLTLDEFHERTTSAYAGRTWGDLRELTTDLPVQPSLGADLPPDAQIAVGASPGAPPTGAPSPAAHLPGAQPTGDPRAFPGGPPAGPSRSQPRPAALEDTPAERRGSGRPFGPVLPVVGMWILFALATRSAGGAVAFIVAIVLLVTLASIGRRPPRGPSGGRRLPLTLHALARRMPKGASPGNSQIRRGTVKKL